MSQLLSQTPSVRSRRHLTVGIRPCGAARRRRGRLGRQRFLSGAVIAHGDARRRYRDQAGSASARRRRRDTGGAREGDRSPPASSSCASTRRRPARPSRSSSSASTRRSPARPAPRPNSHRADHHGAAGALPTARDTPDVREALAGEETMFELRPRPRAKASRPSLRGTDRRCSRGPSPASPSRSPPRTTS